MLLIISGHLHNCHMRSVTRITVEAGRLKSFEESLVHQTQLVFTFSHLGINNFLSEGRHPFETDLELLVRELGQDLRLDYLTHDSFGVLKLGLCDVSHQHSDMGLLDGSIFAVNLQVSVFSDAGLLNFLHSSTDARVVNL